MHLIYFVQYFPPEKASGLTIVMDMINGFADYGWDVDVYVPTPTRGVTDEIRREFSRKRLEIHCNGKLRIHRMHLYREGKGLLQRTIRYTVFSFQCLIRGLFLPADAIFTGGGPPTQGLVAALIHKLTRKKVIYNPQDLFPDSLIVSGIADEKSMIVRLGRVMEKISYNNADSIITITTDMADSIRSKIKNGDKVHIIRNWVDIDKVHPIDRKENKLFDELSLPRDNFYVTYAGNIGKMQGIETIVYAAEQLKNIPDIRFVIFGNGSEEANIKNLAKEKGLINVHFFPLQSLDRVSEVYSLGDVSIVSCKPGTGSIGMPSKTWTIMAAGSAIIASFDLGGEMERVIQEANCGFCVEAGNAEKLADAIFALYCDLNQKNTMGLNARNYAVQHACKAVCVGRYIEEIESIANINLISSKEGINANSCCRFGMRSGRGI